MPQNVAIAPRERSKPPLMSTNVMPMEASQRTEMEVEDVLDIERRAKSGQPDREEKHQHDDHNEDGPECARRRPDFR